VCLFFFLKKNSATLVRLSCLFHFRSEQGQNFTCHLRNNAIVVSVFQGDTLSNSFEFRDFTLETEKWYFLVFVQNLPSGQFGHRQSDILLYVNGEPKPIAKVTCEYPPLQGLLPVISFGCMMRKNENPLAKVQQDFQETSSLWGQLISVMLIRAALEPAFIKAFYDKGSSYCGVFEEDDKLQFDLRQRYTMTLPFSVLIEFAYHAQTARGNKCADLMRKLGRFPRLKILRCIK